MRRRVLLENLRSHDPVTLEVVIQDPVRRPLVQLHPITVVDLVTISEVEDLPRSLHKLLEGFSSRTGRELADLPDEAMIELLTDLDQVAPEQVGGRFRELLATEAQRDTRPIEIQRGLNALLERWSNVEPEPVHLGTRSARIHRAAAKKPPVERPRRGVGVAEEPRPRKEASQGPARRLDLGGASGVDLDRARWVRDAAMERMAMAREQGLSEQVLIAGLRHRAREEFPDLAPNQIIAVLRDMADQGLVRHSAGRWRLVGNW